MPTLKKRGKVWYGIWWEGKGKDRKKRWKALSPSKEEATDKLKEQSDLLKAKRYNHKTTNVSWGTFCKEYRKLTAPNKSAASQDRDKRTIKLFDDLVTVRTMADLSAQLLQTYILGRHEKGIKDSSINRELNTLKHMSKSGKQWGYLGFNPWADVPKFFIPEGEPNYFAKKDSQEVYSFCSDAYERTIHNLASLQGLRPGEMAIFKWTNLITWKALSIIKTGGRRANPKLKARIIPLHPQTVRDLKELKKWKWGEYVLGQHGRQQTSRYIARVYKRILERCGKIGSIYKGRHTFGTNLAEKKVNIRLIQDLLGHSKLNTTQVYVHPTDKGKKDAIGQLPGHD